MKNLEDCFDPQSAPRRLCDPDTIRNELNILVVFIHALKSISPPSLENNHRPIIGNANTKQTCVTFVDWSEMCRHEDFNNTIYSVQSIRCNHYDARSKKSE